LITRDSGVAQPSEINRALTHLLVDHGVAVVDRSLEHTRTTAKVALAELPRRAFALRAGDPVLATVIVSRPTPHSNQ
jgi:hypothetical protein